MSSFAAKNSAATAENGTLTAENIPGDTAGRRSGRSGLTLTDCNYTHFFINMRTKKAENIFFELPVAVFCKIIINFAAQKN